MNQEAGISQRARREALLHLLSVREERAGRWACEPAVEKAGEAGGGSPERGPEGRRKQGADRVGAAGGDGRDPSARWLRQDGPREGGRSDPISTGNTGIKGVTTKATLLGGGSEPPFLLMIRTAAHWGFLVAPPPL